MNARHARLGRFGIIRDVERRHKERHAVQREERRVTPVPGYASDSGQLRYAPLKKGRARTRC